VFDFDGVLVERGEELAPRERVVELAKLYAKLGYRVAVVSWRRARDRKKVVGALWSAGLGPKDIYKVALRPEDERASRMGEVEWKLEQLEQLAEAAGELCEVHDDNAEVLEAAGRRFSDVCLVIHQPGDFFFAYRETPKCRFKELAVRVP